MARKSRSAGAGSLATADVETPGGPSAGTGELNPAKGLRGGGKAGSAGGRIVRAPEGHGMVEAVMRGAADKGLTRAKDARIAGRVSRELIAEAKARTGLVSDTELVEFALATVALEDDFAEAFRKTKGSVDADLDLGF